MHLPDHLTLRGATSVRSCAYSALIDIRLDLHGNELHQLIQSVCAPHHMVLIAICLGDPPTRNLSAHTPDHTTPVAFSLDSYGVPSLSRLV